MGLVLMALLPIVTLVLSGYGFTQYRNVVDSEHRADGLNTLHKQEERGILKFLGGAKNGADTYAEAHNKFLEMKLALELTTPTRRREVQSIIEGEQRINEQLSMGTAGFFEEFGGAQQGLIEKNNKHVTRLLGYKRGWVDPRGADDSGVLEILDNIRQERIIVNDFNPRFANADVILQEFRSTNDFVVDRITRLWQHELDVGISRTSSPSLKSKLSAVKRIVGQITATSFPAISGQDARLLGIIRHEEGPLRVRSTHRYRGPDYGL